MRRAVAGAVACRPPTTAADPARAGRVALALGEAGMAEGSSEQANVTEAKQAAYLTVTTTLARHSISARSRSEVAEAQEVAELLWLASRWLWSELAPQERVGACRVPPASAAPTLEVRARTWDRLRGRPDRR